MLTYDEGMEAVATPIMNEMETLFTTNQFTNEDLDLLSILVVLDVPQRLLEKSGVPKSQVLLFTALANIGLNAVAVEAVRRNKEQNPVTPDKDLNEITDGDNDVGQDEPETEYPQGATSPVPDYNLHGCL